MKSAGKARSNGLYRHIRTSKEIIRNLLNDFLKISIKKFIVWRKRSKSQVISRQIVPDVIQKQAAGPGHVLLPVPG